MFWDEDLKQISIALITLNWWMDMYEVNIVKAQTHAKWKYTKSSRTIVIIFTLNLHVQLKSRFLTKEMYLS